MYELSTGQSKKDSDIGLNDIVSLAGMKEVAKKLPLTSEARVLILVMDDFMPRWEALGQLMVISRILEDDLVR